MRTQIDNPQIHPFVSDHYCLGKPVENTFHRGGLCLRDYFAAHIVQAFVEDDDGLTYRECAKAAYEVADAMLEARVKKQEGAGE